jgi:hypothetical protein
MKLEFKKQPCRETNKYGFIGEYICNKSMFVSEKWFNSNCKNCTGTQTFKTV